MPGFDQTGPGGRGPMTGRRMGRCTGSGTSVQDFPGGAEVQEDFIRRGRGFGAGRGKGFAAGRGSGQGRGFGAGKGSGSGRGCGRGFGRSGRGSGAGFQNRPEGNR